jgi:hypothetical protein
MNEKTEKNKDAQHLAFSSKANPIRSIERSEIFLIV